MNIDDCNMWMKSGYEIDVRKKQKKNMPDVLRKYGGWD